MYLFQIVIFHLIICISCSSVCLHRLILHFFLVLHNNPLSGMYHGFFIYWVKYFIASKVWQLWPTINTFGDFPDGSMFKSPPSHVGDVGLIAGGGIKIPYAVGHLSAFATTTEPMFWSPSATAREMPVHRNQEIMCCKERSWVQQLRKTWCSHNFFFFF